MKRTALFVFILVLITGTQAVFAQFELPEPIYLEPVPMGAVAVQESVFVYVPAVAVIDLPEYADLAYLWAFNPGDSAEPLELVPITTLAAAAGSDAGGTVIPSSLRNNQYFLESVRLRNLAQQSFDYGDYDASSTYAAEALRYAQLSDEYVALQLKIKDTDDAIKRAKDRMDWAASKGIDKSYPREYGEAQTNFKSAQDLRAAEDWDGSIQAAQRVLYALQNVQDVLPLPAQYTVRTWAQNRDCLWNIAGYPWVYNDPFKWKVLYDANKAKMPQPNNPDLIEPGMVLDIPSVQGESRQGMWQSGRTYAPLPPKK